VTLQAGDIVQAMIAKITLLSAENAKLEALALVNGWKRHANGQWYTTEEHV
jgi:hypothetical protein